MYLVLRCKCNLRAKDNSLILLTLIILVFFLIIFLVGEGGLKKTHPEESGRGCVQA